MSLVSDTTADSDKSPNRLEAIGPGRQFSLAAYWFAVNLHWIALLQIIIPKQVEQMEPERQALWMSIILGVGAVIPAVVPPVVGALSDRCTSRLGRRKPYMLVGAAVNLAGLALLWFAGNRSSIWLYLAGYLLVQFGNNVATASYSGIIPDVVPEAQRGSASGWMAVMTQLGNIVGAVASGLLMHNGHVAASYLVIGVSLALFLWITLAGMREKCLETAPPRINWLEMIKGFWIDPRKYPDFGWVWLTRFLFTLGMWMVQPYVQLYLRDVVRVKDYVAQTSNLLALALIGATFTGFLGGWVSDRIGRKRVVYIANGMMAVTAVAFLFSHSLAYTLSVGVIYGLAFGAYYSVDWALGCDVLPNKEDAAKDMGVWHISMVLPQSLAPFLSGLILTACGFTKVIGPEGKEYVQYALNGYIVTFCLAAFFLLLSAVLLRNVRGVR